MLILNSLKNRYHKWDRLNINIFLQNSQLRTNGDFWILPIHRWFIMKKHAPFSQETNKISDNTIFNYFKISVIHILETKWC